MEQEENAPKANTNLLEALERCGHFLYHRRSGKKGQEKILRLMDSWETHDTHEHEKRGMDQLTLQEMLGIQSGSMSEILRKMESKGWVQRNRQQEDRRRVGLRITQAGREALEEEREKREAQDALLFTDLNAQEQQKLEELLIKLLKSWEKRFDPALLERHGRCGREKKEGGGNV